jgi:hypothetical protein
VVELLTPKESSRCLAKNRLGLFVESRGSSFSVEIGGTIHEVMVEEIGFGLSLCLNLGEAVGEVEL